MNSNHVVIAFGLTLFAGLATGIGGFLVLSMKTTSRRFLSASLGFSAGAMIYVSLLEMLPDAKTMLIQELGSNAGAATVMLAFFGGMLVMALIDKLVPEVENPHHPKSIEEEIHSQDTTGYEKLARMSFLTATAIAIHNFPEGIATFFSSLQSPRLGIMVAIAVAIHNIPEGIAIAVPLMHATDSRRRTMLITVASGLAEPLGALLGYFLLARFIGPSMLGIIFSAVSGIMIYISLDELLPAAREYGKAHLAIYGLMAGMAVMAISILLLNW